MALKLGSTTRGFFIGDDISFIGSNNALVSAGGYNTSSTPVYSSKLTAYDGAGGDSYGRNVAIGDGHIAVASIFDDDGGTSSGSAYLYRLDGTLVSKLIASDDAASDQFGSSIAIGDNLVVVGAFGKSSNTGAAYIFDLGGTQKAKLTASDAAASDYFGASVAIGSGRIVVGAWGDATNRGSIYIFDLDGRQIKKSVASDGASNDLFGISVAIGCGKIVVGAPGDDSSKGAAYVFDLNGNQLLKLVASDGSSTQRFGESVDIDNGLIVVGASAATSLVSGSGAAYIFNLIGLQIGKFYPSDLAANDSFGDRIAMNDSRIVVNAYRHDSAGTDAGAVYVFNLNGTQISKLVGFDTAGGDNFGRSIAISDGRIVIGAVGDGFGSAYIYTTPDIEGGILDVV